MRVKIMDENIVFEALKKVKEVLDYYNIEHYDYITDNGNIAVREKGDDINEEVQQTGNSDRKWNGGISDLRLGQGPIDSDSELDNSDNL